MENNLKILNELIEDPIFKEVSEYSKKFNLFETLKIFNTEIRHSNLLGWLLNPRGNHGLGVKFLRMFISKITSDYDENSFKDASVKREWNDIDILVESIYSNFVLVIENKIWSGEAGHQLKKYKGNIERQYRGYDRLFVFLTPYGSAARYDDGWEVTSYKDILDILDELYINNHFDDEKVKLFIEQYIEVLRRNIVGDKKLEGFVNDIYYKHREALDLIIKHRPDIREAMPRYVFDCLNEYPQVILDECTKKHIRFTTTKIDSILNKCGKGWTSTNRVLLFEFVNEKNLLDLIVTVGTTDDEYRDKVIDTISSSDSYFSDFEHYENKSGTKWTVVKRVNILPVNYSQYLTIDEAKDIIKELVRELMSTVVDEVEEILSKL